MGEPSATIDWAWHDTMIFGLLLRPPDPDRGLWRSELVLDVDYIVEWTADCRWRVAPAALIFDWVSDLRIDVDFTGSPLRAAITEWSIHEVERTPAQGKGGEVFHWRIRLNVPEGGEIAFTAGEHRLLLRGVPRFLEEARGHDRPPLVLP